MTELVKMHEKVKQFMEAADQLPAPTNSNELRQELATRGEWLASEYEELIDALLENDSKEILDALADIAYVAVGSQLILPADEESEFYPPSIVTPVDLPDTVILETLKSEVEHGLSGKSTIEGYRIQLMFIISSVVYLAEKVFLVDFQKAFDEVHRSNMTKLVNGKLFKDETGKVQKPDTFEEPRIKHMICHGHATREVAKLATATNLSSFYLKENKDSE